MSTVCKQPSAPMPGMLRETAIDGTFRGLSVAVTGIPPLGSGPFSITRNGVGSYVEAPFRKG